MSASLGSKERLFQRVAPVAPSTRIRPSALGEVLAVAIHRSPPGPSAAGPFENVVAPLDWSDSTRVHTRVPFAAILQAIAPGMPSGVSGEATTQAPPSAAAAIQDMPSGLPKLPSSTSA